MKYKEILYKKWSFREVVLLSLFLDFIEIPLLSYRNMMPIMLLAPAFLLMMFLNKEKKDNSLAHIGSIFGLLLFFLFAYLIFGVGMQNEKVLEFFNTISIFFSLSTVFLLFAGKNNGECLQCMREHFLFLQLILLLVMNGLMVAAIQYHIHSGGEPHALYTQLYLIPGFFLVVGLFLKIRYLYRDKHAEEEIFSFSRRIMEQYKKQLLDIVEQKKLYLNAEFNKEQLAEECGIPLEDLDYLLHYYLEKKYPHFLAEYRIAYALELMEKEGDVYTMQGIAQKSGFKSRTNFNYYFKLITGEVPSKFLHSQ